MSESKSLHNNGPAYVKDILHWYAPTRDLRSMNCPTLVPMECRSIMVHSRLLHSGSSKLWNDLPKAIKCAVSLTLFKKNSYKLPFSVSNNITTNYIIYVHVLYVCTCMYSLSTLIIECNYWLFFSNSF